MADDRRHLPGSEHSAPLGMRAVGPVPPDEPITVSIYLKPRGEAGADGARGGIARARAVAQGDDITAIGAFAEAHGLAMGTVAPERRLVQVSGPAAAMERAFGATLHHYTAGADRVRGREGALTLPADLVERIDAVLGLDTSPIATPKIVPHRGATPPKGLLPTEVAALYGLGGHDASGQCVALIELGGGFTDADNRAAFTAMGLPVPEIVAVSVDGGANAPGDPQGADGEVALDIQVVGGVAPGARIAVYFAPNTSQGFVDAITQALHDDTNRPSAISISWGSPESGWSGQARAAMNAALADAGGLGVTVTAASGDALATDGLNDGKAHVDFPASNPDVLGCGGTRLSASGTRIAAETVWNSNGGGTGGGVSAVFARPAYQADANVPHPAGRSGGRGVPDVAGNADPDSGYRTVTDGQTGIVGGTSAVAPLWAGLVAAANAARGAPLGDVHALLYGQPHALGDITSGDNKVGAVGYAAAPGWDACTGLGAPRAGLWALLTAAAPA